MHVNSLSAVLVVNLELCFKCTYQPPPQRIGVGVKVLLFGLGRGVLLVGHAHRGVILFHQVDEEGRQDERQEADVPGCDQLLQKTGKYLKEADMFILNPIKDCSNSLFTHSQLSSRFQI